MSGPAQQSDPWLGRVIDERFKIEAFLGIGAVGAVYRAQDLQQQRPVALKIWNGRSLNAQTRGRFAREAAALMTLHHPNIIDVYSCGIADDLPYFVIEYLDGETLEQKLVGDEPLDGEEAFEIARQMLTALAYAHELGIVHRDLKPDNVFLVRTPDGKPLVKLLDYGLAKFLAPGDDPAKNVALTMTGMVMGTPLYMAPEQASGKAVDVRVDVYAVGCMLFEMLSGEPPFRGETNMELFRAHMMTKVPSLSAARDNTFVAPALQALLEKALAKQPDQRFAHAGLMLKALEEIPQPAVRGKRGSLDFRPSAISELVTTRSTGVMIVAGLVVGLVVLGVVYLFLRRGR